MAPGVMYWTEGNYSKIYRRGIYGGASEMIYDTTVDSTGSWGFARDLALDVEGHKLYWVHFNSGTSPGVYWIRRADVDGSNVEDLVAINDPDGICCEVYGLAVSSALNKMCWGRESTGTVECAHLDGTGRQVVVSGLTGLVTFAGIDERAGHLYWFSGGLSGATFRRSDLDGQNQESLYFSLNWPSGTAIDVPTGYVYWISTYLYRAKLDGQGVEWLGPATPDPGRVAIEPIPAGVPATSEWGVMALALLLVSAGTLATRRRILSA